jgi:xanthine dehydrogenase accessory factor
MEADIPRSPPGGLRAVLEASALASRRNEAATLAVVAATEGSTYVRAGALALFGGAAGQVGWFSGGCLEPEIERHARQAAALGRIAWLDIDTRGDEDLLSGSAVGCRGRLRIALLPLGALPGWGEVVAQWQNGSTPLRLALGNEGEVSATAGDVQRLWSLKGPAAGDESLATACEFDLPPPPAALVLGAGPETATLLPLLRNLGWVVTLVERRPRWMTAGAPADVALTATPGTAVAQLQPQHFDAALVMHHHFELDREALEALASTAIAFIGLLGPVRRREDLFRVLPRPACESLAPRLHSPVGLDLGGHGPEAIALSIAAELHRHRHSP